MSAKVLILNGPNLNLLGEREPEVYGTTTLADIKALCEITAQAHGLIVDFRQSNHEGQLIDWVQEVRKTHAGIIVNAAGYTHSSVALHDALKAANLPIIEVHLSNPKARETFRHVSYIEPLAAQVIAGKGAQGYTDAIVALAQIIHG